MATASTNAPFSQQLLASTQDAHHSVLRGLCAWADGSRAPASSPVGTPDDTLHRIEDVLCDIRALLKLHVQGQQARGRSHGVDPARVDLAAQCGGAAAEASDLATMVRDIVHSVEKDEAAQPGMYGLALPTHGLQLPAHATREELSMFKPSGITAAAPSAKPAAAGAAAPSTKPAAAAGPTDLYDGSTVSRTGARNGVLQFASIDDVVCGGPAISISTPATRTWFGAAAGEREQDVEEEGEEAPDEEEDEEAASEEQAEEEQAGAADAEEGGDENAVPVRRVPSDSSSTSGFSVEL